MKTLVLGTGAREHALAWKLGQSLRSHSVFLHPGNAGTLRSGIPSLGPAVDVKDPEAVARKAEELGIRLMVIGPENFLAQGYADLFRSKGFLVVGPNQAAAQLETSKVFAKQFMDRAKIPTAPYSVVSDAKALVTLLEERDTYPVVLKLDGLAAGKGVVICDSLGTGKAFARKVWDESIYGQGDHQVIVEQCLFGREISYIGLCDGHQFLPLASATDYKNVGEGNTGPNTGGMGCVSPSPFLTPDIESRIQSEVVTPLLAQLRAESLDYRGALYIGVMVSPDGSPSVLEFNTRFGDPETQATLIRLESDLLSALEATAKGTLTECPPLEWSSLTSLYVVGAALGYPEKVVTGDTLYGLDAIESSMTPFFAGVKAGADPSELVTSGGRVLGLGCLGTDIDSVREQTYRNLDKISWRGMHYRRDIGLSHPSIPEAQ